MSPEASVGGVADGFGSGPPAPEEGSALLADVETFLGRFVAFPSEDALIAVALWVAHCHAVEAFESTPRMAFISPEKQSGKTRALEVLDQLVPNAMHAVNLSAAALFRQVSSKRVTLLLDECDTYLGPRVAKDHEELRGLINAGHRRGAVAYRCVGEPSKMQVVEFKAFAPVALGGIGDLPDTIIDRSIVIRMRRRASGEKVEPFRLRRVRPEGEALRKRIEAWAAQNFDVLEDVEPQMPEGIVDRPADVWEALLAIADVAGSGWPERAREACTNLNNERQKVDPSLGVLLLSDIRLIFETLENGDTDGVGIASDRISSQLLVKKLCDLEEAPWGDLRGKPIDPRGVARRLRPYEIRPTDINFGTGTLKGYMGADFVDAWARYLPPLPPPGMGNEGNESNRPSDTLSASAIEAQVAEVADVAPVSGRERHNGVADQEEWATAWNASLPEPDEAAS